jgi:uncharacterized protein (DUF427 family)
MTTKPVRVPGPDHPITITPAKEHIRVTAGGRQIADTRAALRLQEASYAAVYYVPRKDVDMAQLERTSHQTYCPYKGDAAYYSIPSGGTRAANAVWSYEKPHPAMAEITEYLAFYPDRVDAIEVGPF